MSIPIAGLRFDSVEIGNESLLIDTRILQHVTQQHVGGRDIRRQLSRLAEQLDGLFGTIVMLGGDRQEKVY